VSKQALRLPVVHFGAEFLVQGYLMRRNVLTYKAPPGNEGYDLICIHPDPKKASKQVRVQVKSRYATDSNQGFPLSSKSLGAFDFLVIAYLNIGYFYRKKPVLDGLRSPTFYTMPIAKVIDLHKRQGLGWEIFQTRGLDLSKYEGDAGFDLIAKKLGVPYPSRSVA
jgi:hypothetical protein